MSKEKKPLPPSPQKKAPKPFTPGSASSAGSGGPEESQLPEPPPRGGQQPGEELEKAPGNTSNQ